MVFLETEIKWHAESHKCTEEICTAQNVLDFAEEDL